MCHYENFILVFSQDNTEILGYVLGLLSLAIACTSRFPLLCRAVSDKQYMSVLVSEPLLVAFPKSLLLFPFSTEDRR